MTDTMLKLIQDVANDFRRTMQEEDFQTFKAMKDCYDWDASDIRFEIEYMINKLYDGMVLDDGTIIANDDSECSYREFKKQVMNLLK